MVALVPNKQQNTSIPEALGATVRRLELQPGDAYLPVLVALEALVTPATRIIW